MDNYGIKSYDQIMEEINHKLFSTPQGRDQMLKWLDKEIEQLDQEIEQIHLKKVVEFDFFKNTMTYKEITKTGEIASSVTRNITNRIRK